MAVRGGGGCKRLIFLSGKSQGFYFCLRVVTLEKHILTYQDSSNKYPQHMILDRNMEHRKSSLNYFFKLFPS